MYTNLKSRVVMLGDDDFFADSADAWDTLFNRETTDGDIDRDTEKGRNATIIATTLIDTLGDIGSAFVTARNNREEAQTPQEQDKWDAVLNRLSEMERPAPISTGVIIGGGAIALGALFLLTRKRR